MVLEQTDWENTDSLRRVKVMSVFQGSLETKGEMDWILSAFYIRPFLHTLGVGGVDIKSF